MGRIHIYQTIDAIVLRFRDKGEVANTIDEHRKIIHDKGYVWWGWWSKNYENTPVDYFSYIEERLKKNSQSIKVFLYHTKERSIYIANCTEIRFSSNVNPEENEQPTPETDRTPAYYRDSRCRLWLKFAEISTADSGILIGKYYSFCEDSDLFFEKRHSNNHLYAAFADCKVTNIEVFGIQKRTIWFLRKQKSSDKDTNIDEWLAMPENYVKHHTYARYGAYKILVLSDLHFTNSEHHHFLIENSDKLFTSNKDYTVLGAINKVIEKVGGYDKIAGLLIAGDFVFIPNENQFRLAEAFVKELMGKASLNPEQVAIVPGNHDIAYTAKPDPNRDLEYASAEARKYYAAFYKSIYGTAPNAFLCGSKKIQLSNGLRIDIICANSCVLEQEKESFVQGYIGKAQWDDIKTQMNLQQNKPSYNYRILLMHHHLVSTTIFSETPEKNRNYNILLDAGRVSNDIRKYGIRLVIHGHGHESGGVQISTGERSKTNETKIDNSYDVISMGSTGSSDLPPGEKNSVGILDFSEFLKVKYEKYYIAPTDREMDLFLKQPPAESWEMPVYETLI